MGLGNGSNIGCLGNAPFAALGVNLGILLDIHGLTLSVTRHDASAPSDIYGEPQDTPEPFSVRLLLVEQELKEEPTIAGGKRCEELVFLGQPGTLLENDIVAYDDHNYDVRHVGRTTAASALVAEVYLAVREVDV